MERGWEKLQVLSTTQNDHPRGLIETVKQIGNIQHMMLTLLDRLCYPLRICPNPGNTKNASTSNQLNQTK